MKRLPTLASLQAFESAARHRSFTRAAVELHRTQGAVSQQIRHLEEHLGLVLFERVRQRIILTNAGGAYLDDVQRMLADITESTYRAMAAGGHQSLNLGVLPSFANSWLVRRIPRFVERHPTININFISRNLPFDFQESRLDAAIHYGEPTWAEAAIYFLLDEKKVAVCSPDFKQRHSIAGPRDLVGVPLLQLRSLTLAWADWFEHRQIAAEKATQGFRFDSFNLIAEAAKVGLGAALLPEFQIHREVEAGHLEIIPSTPGPSNRAYYFVCPEEKSAMPTVVAFRDWIQEEAALERSAVGVVA
ncbi:MAG: LysR family transcriptional regulator [Nitratireductor sp.]|nr:LysR family transcriptional regulator [Nitratireductor sp.]